MSSDRRGEEPCDDDDESERKLMLGMCTDKDDSSASLRREVLMCA